MELIPVPELDITVEGSVLMPAAWLVPTEEAEARALRALIGAVVEPSTSVRFGRPRERRHLIVDNGYRDGRCAVRWQEEGSWRGWCVSELDTLELHVAARVVDVRGETRVQYCLTEPEYGKEMHRSRLVEVWEKIHLQISEEIAAVSA